MVTKSEMASSKYLYFFFSFFIFAGLVVIYLA